MSIVNNLFVLTFAVAVDDGVFVYTGNVGTCLGASGGAIEATTVLTSSILSLFVFESICIWRSSVISCLVVCKHMISMES